MSLTNTQRNLIVTLYFVMTLDLLITIIGISIFGAGEVNPLVSWIKPLPFMFTIMFVVNIIIILILIGLFNCFNKSQKTELIGANVEKIIITSLKTTILLRFLTGPILAFITVCVV